MTFDVIIIIINTIIIIIIILIKETSRKHQGHALKNFGNFIC